ncbi:MAG: ribonuclease HII [Cyclobacteriaceae bacterium]
MLKSYYRKGAVEAGCDEAGRGCLAGPVVAAAVILPPTYTHPTLNDSKQLRSTIRHELVSDIKSGAIAWAVGQCDHKEIDQINILNASFLAMHKAIKALVVQPDLLLIDGNRFNAFEGIPHECIIKGDGKYLAIAAASVLAKTYRDDLMTGLSKEYPEYGWQTNFGYPTKKHRAAIAECGPTPHHRMSFQLLPRQMELFDKPSNRE